METKILSEIKKRRAFRAFSTEKVEKDTILRILEAASLAPSCANMQPWRFLVLTEESALQKGFKTLASRNYWATHCAFLIFVVTRKDLDCQLPDGREYALFDTGLAVGNMMLQAVHEGLTAHPMAGFTPAAVIEEFGIPDEYEVVISVSFGFPGDGSYLSDEHKKREQTPQTRKSLEEISSMNGWNL